MWALVGIALVVRDHLVKRGDRAARVVVVASHEVVLEEHVVRQRAHRVGGEDAVVELPLRCVERAGRRYRR